MAAHSDTQLNGGGSIPTTPLHIKHSIPFDVSKGGVVDYLKELNDLDSPKSLVVKTVKHGYANKYVFNHHYLQRKMYIARNVSYGIFLPSERFCAGVVMYGYPVWREYPGLVPPLVPAQCPELLRLCTMSGVPANTESRFIGLTLRYMRDDWKHESDKLPQVVTSFCDESMGFSGALYKSTNFIFYRRTSGRPSNPGGSHGKWGRNKDTAKAMKAMYVYVYRDSIWSPPPVEEKING